MEKRLYKSDSNRVITGVCGGIGEYFGVDPVWIRVIWVIMIFAVGTGLLAYLIIALIVPNRPHNGYDDTIHHDNSYYR